MSKRFKYIVLLFWNKYLSKRISKWSHSGLFMFQTADSLLSPWPAPPLEGEATEGQTVLSTAMHRPKADDRRSTGTPIPLIRCTHCSDAPNDTRWCWLASKQTSVGHKVETENCSEEEGDAEKLLRDLPLCPSLTRISQHQCQPHSYSALIMTCIIHRQE